jgi:hypothetical protein
MEALPLILIFLSLCSTILSAPNFSVSDFEKRFLSHYPTNNSNSIRLIGYKKIFVPADEIAEFEGHWNSEKVAWSGRYSDSYNYFSHVFYDSSENAIRLYFPVEGALLEHDSGIIEADELGQLPPHINAVKGPCKVLGRKKTHHVHGVEGNVIKDGIIYLAEPTAPIRQHGKAYVYDFGTKDLHDHDHDHDHSNSYDVYVVDDEDEYEDGEYFELARHGRAAARDAVHRRSDNEENEGSRRKRKSKDRRETPAEGSNADQSATQPNKGCVANHGGINCSKKYGYNEGRCPFNPKTCMDYNGYFTDCVKGTNEEGGIPSMGKTIKFIGSDCSMSVSDGHCWNEL